MEKNRGRYQAGSLQKRKTRLGPCWYIRFTDSAGKRRPIRVGLVADLPSKKSAMLAAVDLRKDFNEHTTKPEPRSFAELVHKYMREEMPARYSTSRSYRSYLTLHILPRWGSRLIEEIKANEVRLWLRDEIALAPKSKGHIHDLMRILYRFAMLCEWIPLGENPMKLFHIQGASKRKAKPRVLDPEEFARLVAAVGREPYQTMLYVAACLGLRCNELFGLRWHDFDWTRNIVRIQRGIVDGRIDKVKTEYSEKDLPLHPLLAAKLLALHADSQFREPDDWVFASPFSAGERPYHSYRVQQYKIKPAATACGLGEGIGWHTLRHTYRSLLEKTGAPIGVQKDLMRHSDIRTTMNIYGDSYMEDLRKGNDGVVGVILQ